MKQHVQQAVSRGKVDVFITVDASAADVAQVTVNRELAAQYAAAMGELAELCGPIAWKLTPEVLASARISVRCWMRRLRRIIPCGLWRGNG